MATSLDYALALWSRGLSMFPVPVPGLLPGRGGDGKTPAMSWKKYQTSRPTEADVQRWFSTDAANIAVITGKISGIVVVDTDSEQAEAWARCRLPRTPWRVRTAQGWHRYFQHPGVRVSNRARLVTGNVRLAVDVRGDGGYVIGPGSLHASGVRYQAVGDWSVPVGRLPRFWLGWIARPTPPRRAEEFRNVHRRGATARAQAYLASIPRPVIGRGSDNATFQAACRLVRGFGLDPATAVDLLIEWTAFDRDWIEKKVGCATKYGTEPQGGRLKVR